MVPFGGWEMPVEYSGITAEHMAVRTRAGVFDVSHMGEIEVAGKDALAAVQRISSNDASRLQVGQAHYSALTTFEGTFVDDMLVYRMAPNHFMMVVNASNIEKDYAWIAAQIQEAGEAAAVDSSSRYALIAIQGPASVDVLQPLCTVDLSTIKYYWFAHGEVASARALISRTGYTGEDGFEIFVPPATADRVWEAILQSGRSADVIPCGLGARDTLRTEMGYALHGNELSPSITPVQARVGWAVGWKKESFWGKDALVAEKAAGPSRVAWGLLATGRGIPRAHCAVKVGDEVVGEVTSGTFSPTLKNGIALALLAPSVAAGDEVVIDVRGREVAATVVKPPFVEVDVREA